MGCVRHSGWQNGSEIVGGGNSRSGVACGSAILHHCCPPFKDADRDLLRLLLMTSAARVQCRSDVDGSWSRPTSFLRDRRGFPVSSVDFLGRHRRRPVLVSGVHANFLTHVSAKAASTALTCEDCGVRFISRLKYKIQAWRHVYDNLCIRLSLALVEAVLKKLALGK